MRMHATPLYNQRALHLASLDTLVVADLHIGIEYDLSLSGAYLPSQTQVLADRILGLIEDTGARRLLINGDLKHMIAPGADSQEYRRALRQEKRELDAFLTRVSGQVEVTLVAGNHDGGLRTGRGLQVVDPRGERLDEAIGCAHGHAWPRDEVMQADLMLMGHVHPVVRLRNSLGYASSQPCWVRAPLREKDAREVYETANANLEVIVMPAFNPLCGGTAVNTEGLLGPLAKIIDLARGQVYLLDGTFLGTVADL